MYKSKNWLFSIIIVLSVNSNAQIKSSDSGTHPLQLSAVNAERKICFQNLKPGTKSSEVKNKQNASHHLLFQNSLIQLIDSIYYWDWDEEFAEWQIYSKHSDFIYDVRNNLISGTYHDWDGFKWTNAEKDSALYDETNNLVYSLWQMWNGIEWENHRRRNMSYDLKNNLKSELTQDWNGTEWENINLLEYSYDSNNNENFNSAKYWNGYEWENSRQCESTYDADNYWLSSICQNWNGIDWEYGGESSCTYDGEHHRITELHRYDNAVEWITREISFSYSINNKLESELEREYGNTWEHKNKSTYFYDSNDNLTKVLYQSYEGDSLINVRQVKYTYDENSNQLSSIYQDWMENIWTTVGLDLYSYDANNYNTGFSLKELDYQGTEVTTGDSTCIYYHTVNTEVSDLKNLESPVNIFPNPTNGFLKITFNAAYQPDTWISVYDYSGKIVLKTQVFNKEENINLKGKIPGLYFIKVDQGTTTNKFKIVLK